MKEIELIISGKVQGVMFRTFIKNRAHELGVFGYVMNCEDGAVEVIAQGEKEQLDKFIEHIKKGPIFARVDFVEILWNDTLQDTFTDFTIKHEY